MSATAKTSQVKTKVFSLKAMVQIGVLGAVSVILMLFEFPLFFAPAFYKLDFSELPVIIGAFAIHPLAGVMIELIKILLNLLINGTITAGVGEAANFLIGCFMVVPAAVIYQRKKTKKNALLGLICGTVLMTAAGCFLNAYILLPAYSTALHMELDKLIEMGSAINPAVNSLMSFVLLAVAPFNLLKGFLLSVVTMLIYKKISIILKGEI